MTLVCGSNDNPRRFPAAPVGSRHHLPSNCFIRYSSSRNSRSCSVNSSLPRATGAKADRVRDRRPRWSGFFGRTRHGGATAPHDPRQQFGKANRVCEVVVAAGAQALDAVVDLSESRENQRWRAVHYRYSHQRADQRQAIALWQHPVDHQRVVVTAIGQADLHRHRQPDRQRNRPRGTP